MRSLNPDTDSHTTKIGKEGFTLKANQKEENLNGCAAPTKTESEGIDTDIEALETYICDNICQYRERRQPARKHLSIISAVRAK